MRLLIVALLAATALCIATEHSHAGARTPDEGFGVRGTADMRNMSDDQLRRRLQDACIYRLAEREETIKTNAVGRCGCYASNVMRTLSKDEGNELRSNGTFGQSARPKAEAALKSCRV